MESSEYRGSDVTDPSSQVAAGNGIPGPTDTRPGSEAAADASSTGSSAVAMACEGDRETRREDRQDDSESDSDSEESACSCPDMAGLCAMLERLAKSKACFVSQQRGEKELSVHEKMRVAHELLHRSPASFLNKFGPHCVFLDVEYLRHFRGEYQVDYHLNRLSRRLTRKDRATVVKNRRYGAVARLEAEGYFDEDEMKRRDPLLYDQMVGRYLTEEEVKAEADRQMRDYRFSSWLLQQADSKVTSALYQWQLQRELQQTEEDEESDEGDDDNEADKLEKPHPGSSSAGGQDLHRRCADNRNGEPAAGGGYPRQPDDAERNALREEFLHIMQERFIDGEDRNFDYGQVDDNDEYDDIELETADAEERYFDVEEPESVDSIAGSSSPETISNAAGDRESADNGSAVEYDY